MAQKPQIQDTVAGFNFIWQAELISIEVSRLRNHNDGRVTGEIAIATTAPGYSPHLHQAQFNFSSTRSRRELAKNLDDRYPDLADWGDILEQLCVYVLDRIRRGEPVVLLRPGSDIRPPEYLLEPLILKNYSTIVFGDPSTAKSTVALIFTQILAYPDSWAEIELGLTPPTEPITALFLDYETDENTANWLLTKLEHGMHLPEFALNYRHCALPLAQDLEQIHQHISDIKAGLVIIDSLGLACGGELKEAESALTFFSALRQLKTTSLILAHTAKNPETKRKTVFGSVFFEAQARSIWEIRKAQDAGEDEIDVALFHRKPPPFQKLCPPFGLNIRYSEDTMVISPAKPRTIGDFISAMGTQVQIEELLKEGPLPIKEIMEALDLSRSAVDTALHRLKKKKRIVKVGADKWGLACQEDLL